MGGLQIIIIIHCVFLFELTLATRLCCAFGYSFRTTNGTCDTNLRNVASIRYIPVFEGETLIGKLDSKKMSIIDNSWCASENQSKWFYPLDGDGLIQSDSKVYVPEERTYFEENDYCLLWTNLEVGYIPVLCGNGDEIEMIIRKSTTYGMMISMPFLLVTFLVYACVPELQNIHGKCLMCYVASLLFALIFLVSVQLHTGNVDPVYCVAAPCIVYFFFMVSFMWLNVMCIDICWTFSGRRGFKGIRNSERKRFVIYNIYAWGIPLIMLIITIALQLSENLPSYIIRPNFGEGRCWFKDDNVVGYYFYGPIILIILANCGLFIYTAAKIYLVQRDTDQSMKQENSQRHGKETDQQRYKLYLKLMMVFGINWSMEIISWAISGPAWLWYVTDMFNALYGVLIFFIFVCKANVWKLVRKRYYVMQGKPMQAQAFGPTSSTRSTAMSHTVTSGTGGGPDSFALTSSNTT